MKPDTGDYPDVPSFILGCTREIWEDRGLGEKLARYYAPDCLVRAPTGVTDSMAGVEADTLQTLHQFPDRELVGEDVIWSGCGDGSFLSSHRLISVMRHTGDGAFGVATGAIVKSRIIADCWVREGVIREEWLVRDGAAFAISLGLTSEALAARLIESDLDRHQKILHLRAGDDRVREFQPSVADDPASAVVVDAYTSLWDAKSTHRIRDHYNAGCAVHLPGGEVANGWSEIDRFIIGVLASIPDARLTVHSAVVNRTAERPTRVALRWALDGTHSGWGRFGAPSGAAVHIMGLSHLHLTEDRIMAEWLLFDEVAIWKQILGHRMTR